MSYVALAVRDYSEGRILIHTDRIDGYQNGHGRSSDAFWRSIFNWTAKKFYREVINVGFLTYNGNNGDDIKRLEPISFVELTLDDIAVAGISNIDCLYFAGLPENVAENVASKIKTFVSNGGSVIIESPDNGDENINVLSGIEDVFCFSSQPPMEDDAYWTIDGNDHHLYTEVTMPFLVSLREEDFSSEWSILMSDVQNTATTTTLGIGQDRNFGNRGGFEFGISYISSMQKGIAVLEEDGSSSSSSSSSLE